MYITEYDLMVAEDRTRELQSEMRAIRMAKAARAEIADHPSLLDRLAALAGRGTHGQASRGKVGAAA